MKLSILICSLESRHSLLKALLTELIVRQHSPEVEVLFKIDEGQITTGEKRNQLIDMATGDYCCFIDDDDKIHPQYVSKIMAALELNPDCVGMEGLITFQSKKITRKFIHSKKYSSWFTKENVYYRSPNHLNPVRIDLAKQVKFPCITTGEDHDYSKRLYPLLKSEVYIPEPIYYYLTR